MTDPTPSTESLIAKVRPWVEGHFLAGFDREDLGLRGPQVAPAAAVVKNLGSHRCLSHRCRTPRSRPARGASVFQAGARPSALATHSLART